MTTSTANGRSTTTANGHGDIGTVLAVLRQEALEVGARGARPVSRVRVTVGDVSLEVDWAGPGGTTGSDGPGQHSTPPQANGSGGLGSVSAAPSDTNGSAASGADAGVGAAAPAGPADDDALAFVIPAHTVGVFYHAPEPGADPFVRPGDTVVAGQQVGIIEAMKLMIPVEAERGGRVREILVADTTPVEYGEPLLTLDVATSTGGTS
ncbi:acetyl-CoA carboxylase biotin carboxyl carrier protein subunit [Parafrankia soli]|uniref:Biotin carboxyl carrier protein of acetyl-CoA carboxylase n=1 Tax=Parafrankia soli TaxID=2599596 RepID=A0A1S1Q614_9ACTN|nr:biotin/lipoyl-containing protein [Parafrankia soli]OHV28921.1 acetyl-CoA carboxylase biotin carboxyl carrier protein subunit [Parafrankia soli]